MKKKIVLFAVILTLITGCGDKKENKQENIKSESEITTTVASTTTIENEATTTVVVSDPTTKKTTLKATTTKEATATPVTTTQPTTTSQTTVACDLKFNNKCYKIGDIITIDFIAKTDLAVEDFKITTLVSGKGSSTYESLDPVEASNPYVSSGTTSDPTDTGFEGFAWIRMNGESLSGSKKIYTLKYKVVKNGEFVLTYNTESAMDREGNDVNSSMINISANVK